jgi:hypothetical protein
MQESDTNALMHFTPRSLRDCVAMRELVMVVILNEVKNLMISTELIIEILRLPPQNDIATQSLRGES